MAHTRPVIDVLEEIDARVATIESNQAAMLAAINANTAAVVALAADIASVKNNTAAAVDVARYDMEHMYGPDPALP